MSALSPQLRCAFFAGLCTAEEAARAITEREGTGAAWLYFRRLTLRLQSAKMRLAASDLATSVTELRGELPTRASSRRAIAVLAEEAAEKIRANQADPGAAQAGLFFLALAGEAASEPALDAEAQAYGAGA